MVGRAGAEQSAPGFIVTGYANPVRLTTSLIGVSGGGIPDDEDHTMNTSIAFSSDSPKVFFKDGRLVTTSQSVADYFDKQHKHVLAKIDALDCSPEFSSANFSADVQTIEVGNGAERESRCYLITKDGFMFLVMGFTGKKAARLKEAYIAKFNAMEAELRNHAPTATRYGNYAVITYFENGRPMASRPLMPDEVVMNPDSCLEHVMRCGFVVIPAAEAGNLTLDELCEMVNRTKRLRRH